MTDTRTEAERETGIGLLLEKNERWAARMVESDPAYFARLLEQQSPAYLWIGCSDSRVPANQIVDLPPGEVFVHRNVANLVYDSDINAQSVLEYAVNVLAVRHIIVCGHYGCGGIEAALAAGSQGLVENWLRPVRRLARRSQHELKHLESPKDRVNRLCELNVMEQVQHVAESTVVENARERGQRLTIHGLVYGLADGRLREFGSSA